MGLLMRTDYGMFLIAFWIRPQRLTYREREREADRFAGISVR